MKSWRFTANDHEVASAKMTKFFHDLIEALKTYHDNTNAFFANKSRQFTYSVLYVALLKLVHPNPGLDISKVFKKLSANTYITVADKIVAPLPTRSSMFPGSKVITLTKNIIPSVAALPCERYIRP